MPEGILPSFDMASKSHGLMGYFCTYNKCTGILSSRLVSLTKIPHD